MCLPLVSLVAPRHMTTAAASTQKERRCPTARSAVCVCVCYRGHLCSTDGTVRNLEPLTPAAEMDPHYGMDPDLPMVAGEE